MRALNSSAFIHQFRTVEVVVAFAALPLRVNPAVLEKSLKNTIVAFTGVVRTKLVNATAAKVAVLYMVFDIIGFPLKRGEVDFTRRFGDRAEFLVVGHGRA